MWLLREDDRNVIQALSAVNYEPLSDPTANSVRLI